MKGCLAGSCFASSLIHPFLPSLSRRRGGANDSGSSICVLGWPQPAVSFYVYDLLHCSPCRYMRPFAGSLE